VFYSSSAISKSLLGKVINENKIQIDFTYLQE